MMTSLDFAVIGLYALGMLAIGVYYARRVRSNEDYLLGGRNMSSFMIGLSLFATMTSTLTYLALPGEMIKNGPVIFAEFLAFPLVFVIVGWWLIPHIASQPVTSGYELLEKRLGLTGRMLGGFMFIVLRIVWMASILYATAHAVIIPLFHLDESMLPYISLTMAAITFAYTVTGGLRAVVMTDALQAMLMMAGAIATIVVITFALGGVGNWWPSSWPSHWADPVFWPQPGAKRTIFAAFLNMAAWMTCTAGSDQMAIQRYLATPSVATARRSFGIQLISNILAAALLALAGLAVLGYFQAYPQDLKEGWSIMDSADKMMPHFIVIGLPAGITGLVIAAILSAAMSSLSSGLNSSAAVIVSDFFGRARGRKVDPAHAVRLARIVSIVVGLVAVALSLVIGKMSENLMELCIKVVNLLTAPIFVLFFLALFVPRSNALTAVIATIASVSAAAAASFAWDSNWFLLSAPAGLTAGVVAGTIASFLMPKRVNDEASSR